MLCLCPQVTEWMSKEGDLHLGQMKEEKAESLGSIHAIQKDFEKFYFTAMVSQDTRSARNESALLQLHMISCTNLSGLYPNFFSAS